ncbi:MAG: DUF302 domain-containing protein [Candidatus Eisenbacteria bacterium]
MGYYFTKVLQCSYEEAIPKVIDALKAEGFGVLTEIDVKATLKKKLDVDFRDYIILGACNPPFAHQALQAERNIGLLLPCNVVVQATEEGSAEVSAIDPVSAMQSVENDNLAQVAQEVRDRLRTVIESL